MKPLKNLWTYAVRQKNSNHGPDPSSVTSKNGKFEPTGFI